MILKNTISSVLGEPAIVTLPLSAVTFISPEVPLCAFAVGATAVPKATSIASLSAVATPDSAQDTVPLFVPDTVKNALNVLKEY